jgi:hypothetical protein
MNYFSRKAAHARAADNLAASIVRRTDVANAYAARDIATRRAERRAAVLCCVLFCLIAVALFLSATNEAR